MRVSLCVYNTTSWKDYISVSSVVILTNQDEELAGLAVNWTNTKQTFMYWADRLHYFSVRYLVCRYLYMRYDGKVPQSFNSVEEIMFILGKKKKIKKIQRFDLNLLTFRWPWNLMALHNYPYFIAVTICKSWRKLMRFLRKYCINLTCFFSHISLRNVIFNLDLWPWNDLDITLMQFLNHRAYIS